MKTFDPQMGNPGPRDVELVELLGGYIKHEDALSAMIDNINCVRSIKVWV